MDYKKMYLATVKRENALKDQVKYLEEELADKEVLAKAYKEHKIEIMKLTKEHEKLEKKMKNLKKDWAEEKEWVKQTGREEAIAEYDKLAFVIGGQYEPNNPSLMISSVELMKQNNEKLKKEVSDNELEMREYKERVLEEYGEDAEALEPQYQRFCEWCEVTRLGINEHIFIYEKDGVDSKTLCQECGEPNPYHTSPYSQLKKEGYTCDEDEEDE